MKLGALVETLPPHKELSPVAQELWLRILEPYSLDQVLSALDRIGTTAKFMPAPANIIELIEGTPHDRGLLAWSRVRMAIAKYGHGSSVDFQDAKIHAAIVGIGGWVKLCSMNVRDLEYIGKEFIHLYGLATGKDGLKALPGAYSDCLLGTMNPPVVVEALAGLPDGTISQTQKMIKAET